MIKKSIVKLKHHNTTEEGRRVGLGVSSPTYHAASHCERWQSLGRKSRRK